MKSNCTLAVGEWQELSVIKASEAWERYLPPGKFLGQKQSGDRSCHTQAFICWYGMVCHYPLFRSAIEEGTTRISAVLLVVRPRRLLRFALLHTVLCTHNWCRDTRTLVRRTFHRTDGYVR